MPAGIMSCCRLKSVALRDFDRFQVQMAVVIPNLAAMRGLNQDSPDDSEIDGNIGDFATFPAMAARDGNSAGFLRTGSGRKSFQDTVTD